MTARREEDADAFARDVLDGLARADKALPCRYFYDAKGSALFEEITQLPEYYPTRAEAAILRACAPQIAAATPAGAVLMEFGSGSSLKTEILLAATPHLAAYVAIDVSRAALEEARQRLQARFPALRVEMVEADFHAEAPLPDDLARAPRVGFFPGSTIGNLAPAEASALLRGWRRILRSDGALILGVDVKKDPAILLPAYNDAAGVTAAFNLNLLARINRELGADFDLAAFRHEAIWNERDSRVEMRLVSIRAQTAHVRGRPFTFAAGEAIHTENSHKWSPAQFDHILAAGGWRAARAWSDADGLFRVLDLRQTA